MITHSFAPWNNKVSIVRKTFTRSTLEEYCGTNEKRVKKLNCLRTTEDEVGIKIYLTSDSCFDRTYFVFYLLFSWIVKLFLKSSTTGSYSKNMGVITHQISIHSKIWHLRLFIRIMNKSKIEEKFECINKSVG